MSEHECEDKKILQKTLVSVKSLGMSAMQLELSDDRPLHTIFPSNQTLM